MKQLENVYAKLPVWLQDAAVSVQGAIYYRQRFGGDFREEHGLLKATEMAPPLQLELLQTARLKRMLAHAAIRVPFYESRIDKKQPARLRVGDWSAFHEVPITEKSDLRRDPMQFCDGGIQQKSWIAWNTSGTTGTPITLFYHPSAVSRQYAYVERYREEAGVSRFERRAQFTGKTIVPGNPSHCFWRHDWANRALMLSTVHLSFETIPKYLEALRQFQPTYLSGYPSAIALLARHALRFPVQGLRIKAILTSAETLLDEQRDVIEAAFGARVHDQYGQTEMQSFWFECRYRRMHAHPLFGVTEILRPNGQPCSPGEMGDIVLTGLINRAMPLIRYRVGDRAAWSDEDRCPCGRSMPMVQQIDGRREDYLYSAERGWIGRMDPALKGVEGLLECQFIQEETGRLRILYVPLPSFRLADKLQLEANLKSRLGSEISFDFEVVPAIPRGANGKFRAVISKLPSNFQPLHGMQEVA